jgi:hypothetical protein
VRTWKLVLKLVRKPARGVVVLTLGAVSVAAAWLTRWWLPQPWHGYRLCPECPLGQFCMALMAFRCARGRWG